MKYLLEHREWMERSEIEDFLNFCQQQLGYQTEPEIEFSDDLQHAKEAGSMGHFDPATGIIWVFKGRRVRADWYRTLAHELVHHAQRERGDELDGTTGSETENEANAKAGEILRAWGKREPAIFESRYGETFPKLQKLSKLGLAHLEDISATVWFPKRTWQDEEFRKRWDRLMVKDLLTDEDFAYLDSLADRGLAWYTDTTPGIFYEKADAGSLLRIVGPNSVVREATGRIYQAFEEAFDRISDDPKGDGLEAGGWSEAIWYMSGDDADERNARWGGGQKQIYARWLRSITGLDDSRSEADHPQS